jgi:hypothetical protein
MWALLRACTAGAVVISVSPVYGADDLPPPLPSALPPAGGTAPATPDASASVPGAAPGTPAAGPQPGAPEAGPAAQPAPLKPAKDARIEEKYVGRRVSEVIVTPAGFTFHYTMTHLDDQEQATTPLQPHMELSVPRFFRIDF